MTISIQELIRTTLGLCLLVTSNVAPAQGAPSERTIKAAIEGQIPALTVSLPMGRLHVTTYPHGSDRVMLGSSHTEIGPNAKELIYINNLSKLGALRVTPVGGNARPTKLADNNGTYLRTIDVELTDSGKSMPELKQVPGPNSFLNAKLCDYRVNRIVKTIPIKVGPDDYLGVYWTRAQNCIRAQGAAQSLEGTMSYASDAEFQCEAILKYNAFSSRWTPIGGAVACEEKPDQEPRSGLIMRLMKSGTGGTGR